MIAAAPLILVNVSTFLFKRAESTSLFDAADASRGALVTKMLTNIEASPWLGIGFGIASEPESMEVIRDPLLGLPVSAVVEKGVTPVAVWEELGFVGALLVLVWSLMALLKAARNGVVALAIALAVVFLNFGEATFFSVGGTGLVLAVFFCAATASSKRMLGS